MITTLFAQLADAFLPSIVKTWVMTTELTSAQAADVLVNTAIKNGFLRDREKPLTGSAINEWGIRKSVPRWAMQAALSMLLENGWVPKAHAEWAGFASIFTLSIKTNDCDLLLSLLPAGFDRDVAAGWLCAALENDAHYRARKKRVST
ncbi:MAG: hypothetical protein ACRDCA_03605 [Serratia sp. (in: enterobacteria)]|uniref:hypothetical protein n=1 Tax=Serratia sp. (in: enterobacteria) TaxID=616 RepID=UPI003F2C4949